MRVLICGSRDWNDYRPIQVVLEGLAALDDLVVITGGARGADALGYSFDGYGVTHEVYPAEWDKYGKRAGYLRNAQMLEDGKPDVVFAFSDQPVTPGTANMVRLAREAGVPTYVMGRA